jgi:hypothetical protein
MQGAAIAAHTTTDWSSIGPAGHAVQFYAGDDELIPLLAGYVGTAVVAGDAAIVIATGPHRDALEACLASRGLSLAIARGQGRLVELDAAETLASMCRDTRIDPESIRGEAIRLIQHARAATGRPRGRVALFGEMVSLLWSAGRVREAVKLEELWNEVQRDIECSLMCSYPMKGFAHHNDAAPFLRVCAQHSHIFPTQQRRLLDPVSPLA